MSDYRSMSWESLRFGDDMRRRLLHHVGDAGAPLVRWRKLLRNTWGVGGWNAVRTLTNEVMPMIASSKVLYCAAVELRSNGPKAPGPNGLRLEWLDGCDLWDLCTALGKAIASDRYRPGDEKIEWVHKSTGLKKRPIVLLDVEDRIVQKAAASVLRPMLDPLFDPLSFAFRAGRQREQGIAVARSLATGGQPIWLTHDLKDAFGRVPVSRLLDQFGKLLPCPRLRELLRLVLPPRSRSLGGIKQGGPLSPLALELYLTRVLHQPWRKSGSPVRVIRYADDTLLMAANRPLAEAADDALRKILLPHGMLLKASFEEAVADVREEPAEWLGFRMRLKEGTLRIQLGENAFLKLGLRFQTAYHKNNPAQRARDTLRHWFGQIGPTFPFHNRDMILRKAEETAVAWGFEELHESGELETVWQAAYARWKGTRRYVRATPGFLAEGPLVPPTPTSNIW